ncbi:MAG: PilZ domain-containing protein [Erythrobacter sp.]
MALAQHALEPLHDVRRTEARLRLRLPARLVLLDRACHCIIENISCTGARLVVDNPPRLAEFGQVQCEGLDHFFETVWCRGNQVGIAFDEPVPRSALLRLRQLNDHFSEVRQRELKALARHWVTGQPA